MPNCPAPSRSAKTTGRRSGITANARDNLTADDITMAIHRHATGDWGEPSPEDASDNDWALKHAGTISSTYRAADGTKFSIRYRG